MKLFTFGDSHATCGMWHLDLQSIGYIDSIRPGLMGPVTMSKVAFDKDVLNIAKQNYGIKSGDIIAYSFGEIDCRIHLVRNKNYPMFRDIVDVLVPRYMESLKWASGPFEPITTMVLNIVPPIKNENVEHHNPYHPHLGTDQQRKEVVLYVNNKLKEYCQNYGFIFIDIYDKYATDDGFINPEFSKDVHIENPIYMTEFFKNLKL